MSASEPLPSSFKKNVRYFKESRHFCRARIEGSATQVLIYLFKSSLSSNVRYDIELMQANGVALRSLLFRYRLREGRSWENTYHWQHRASVGLHIPINRVIPWRLTAPRALKDSYKYAYNGSLLQKDCKYEKLQIPSRDLKCKRNANGSKALLNPWSFRIRNAVLEITGWT